MKLIYPYVDLIQQEPGFDGMIRHIEKCGRTCYKSEDKITQDSADTFFNNLLKNKHYAMLEHGAVYLLYKTKWTGDDFVNKYKNNQYSVIKFVDCDKKDRTPDGWVQSMFYITTNYRVLQENGWLNDLQYICEPTECHVPRITLKFTTNIGVTREGNRHRVMSIAEESTRYCNYTKDKFGGELNIVPPVWLSSDEIDKLQDSDESEWLDCICEKFDTSNPDFCNASALEWYAMSITFSEIAYRNLIRLGWTPQQAREVLPLATKSDVVYTAFPHQWKHFFDLRLFGTTGKPHPNMQEIAELAQGVLEENGLWNLIYNPNDKTK